MIHTSVSVPDELFREAEELARRSGRSRSQVYSDALAEYLQLRDRQSVTASWNAVLAEVGCEVDPWVAEIGRQTLERVEWE